VSFCDFIPAQADVIIMEPGPYEPEPAGNVRPKNLAANGLRVTSYTEGSRVQWVIRSKNVVITATGKASAAVLRTLTTATSRALAAPGILKGTEYLEALTQAPVTGLVSVTRLDTHGPALPAAHAFDGQYSDTLPPGRYRLSGQDGNAPCPSILTTVSSGRTTVLPAIGCQGS
jgi:hypothetical protein